MSIPFFWGIVVIVGSFVALSANVIQFGLDQLHDASTDDSVIYIHWYVWTYYLGMSLVKLRTLFKPAKGNDDSLYIIIMSLLVSYNHNINMFSWSNTLHSQFQEGSVAYD